jgi:hypothetical protein
MCRRWISQRKSAHSAGALGGSLMQPLRGNDRAKGHKGRLRLESKQFVTEPIKQITTRRSCQHYTPWHKVPLEHPAYAPAAALRAAQAQGHVWEMAVRLGQPSSRTTAPWKQPCSAQNAAMVTIPCAQTEAKVAHGTHLGLLGGIGRYWKVSPSTALRPASRLNQAHGKLSKLPLSGCRAQSRLKDLVHGQFGSAHPRAMPGRS